MGKQGSQEETPMLRNLLKAVAFAGAVMFMVPTF